MVLGSNSRSENFMLFKKWYWVQILDLTNAPKNKNSKYFKFFFQTLKFFQKLSICGLAFRCITAL